MSIHPCIACVSNYLPEPRSPYLSPHIDIEFKKLRSILLVAVTYKVQHIIDSGIRRLRILFPKNYDAWTNWIVSGSSSPVNIVAVDAVAVVDLAHKAGCLDLLPAALYACCSLSNASLLNGAQYGADKFKLSHRSVLLCLDAREKLVRARASIIRHLMTTAHIGPELATHLQTPAYQDCWDTLRELGIRMVDDHIVSSPLCFSSLCPWLDWAENQCAQKLCATCKNHLKAGMAMRMREAWTKLPEIFDLANWPPS